MTKFTAALVLAVALAACSSPSDEVPPSPGVQHLGEGVGFESCGAIRSPDHNEVMLFTEENFGGTCWKINVWWKGDSQHYLALQDLGTLNDQAKSAKAWVSNFVDFYDMWHYNQYPCACSPGGLPACWCSTGGYWDRIAPWEVQGRMYQIPMFRGVQGCSGTQCPPWSPSSLIANSNL